EGLGVGSWSQCMRECERRLSMNGTPRRQVLECASPLALSNLVQGRNSGRGLPQSKTLARQRPFSRGSWSQCMRKSERRLSRSRPTPNPSQEGSRRSSAPCPFPSWEGLRVGSWSQCVRGSERELSMNQFGDDTFRL